MGKWKVAWERERERDSIAAALRSYFFLRRRKNIFHFPPLLGAHTVIKGPQRLPRAICQRRSGRIFFFHVARLCALVAGYDTYPPLFSQKKKTLGCKKIPIAKTSNGNFQGETEALLVGLLRGDRMDGRRAADTNGKRQRSGPGSPPRCNTRKRRRRMSGVGEMHGE